MKFTAKINYLHFDCNKHIRGFGNGNDHIIMATLSNNNLSYVIGDVDLKFGPRLIVNNFTSFTYVI